MSQCKENCCLCFVSKIVKDNKKLSSFVVACYHSLHMSGKHLIISVRKSLLPPEHLHYNEFR